MRYALIENGIVTNIIWLHPIAKAGFPNAVATNDYPVSIGDTYDGEYFYRNGERVLSLSEEMEDMRNALVNELGVNVDG